MPRRLACLLALTLLLVGCSRTAAPDRPATIWVGSDRTSASMVQLVVDGTELSGSFHFTRLTTLGAPVEVQAGTLTGTRAGSVVTGTLTHDEQEGTTPVSGTLSDDVLVLQVPLTSDRLATLTLAPGSADFYNVAAGKVAGTAADPAGVCVFGSADAYRFAECDEPVATLVVLSTRSTGGECRTVPGASESWSRVDGPEFCLGVRGEDPARAINAAVAGDCLAIVDGEAERTPCTASDAVYLVLQRFTDVNPGAEAARCQAVPGVAGHVSWTWLSESASTIIDVLLCIGPRP